MYIYLHPSLRFVPDHFTQYTVQYNDICSSALSIRNSPIIEYYSSMVTNELIVLDPHD